MTTRKFNHDLAIEVQDQDTIAKRWPNLAQALIPTPLMDDFIVHEKAAKHYKLWLQWTGTIAVILMLFALITSAISLWPAQPLQNFPVWLSEACALVGLVMAFLASRFGPLRGRWLRHRFLTEIYRSWHFRHLLNSMSHFAKPDFKMDAYLKERLASFQNLTQNLAGEVGDHLDRLIENGDTPLPDVDTTQQVARNPSFNELTSAYLELRIDHQLNYAVHKLSVRDRSFLGLSNRILTEGFRMLAGFSLLAALVLSASQFIPQFSDEPRIAWVSMIMVVIGVAARAWRDGMQLSQEQQNFIQYRKNLEDLRSRWKSSDDPSQRLTVAAAVEKSAEDEITRFMRNHNDAQFLF